MVLSMVQTTFFFLWACVMNDLPRLNIVIEKDNKFMICTHEKNLFLNPPQCHLCVWPIRYCLNEGGERKTSREP